MMVAQRLRQAINDHDLDAFVDCFRPDYRSEQPAHPARAFQGRERVRENWGVFFRQVPDLRAELLTTASADGTEWSEWHWHGTREDGTRFEMRGVIIMGLQDDRISWARLYMEEVEAGGEDIEASVQRLAEPKHQNRE
ncbi:nuclear transport factor 2 family protein [Streptomyces swartbergensis]|uniref:nuclear transport factor 2 family protein n=1 Tax=Streptomyces swartbergensis TaxID=487165 RepID=UPI00381B9CFD